MPFESSAYITPETTANPEPMTLADCPVRTTLDVLKGKWKPLILFFLKPGTRRYSDLRANRPEATEEVLIQQLQELERDGIVEREVYPERPPQVDYRISEHGRSLMVVLRQMADRREATCCAS